MTDNPDAATAIADALAKAMIPVGCFVYAEPEVNYGPDIHAPGDGVHPGSHAPIGLERPTVFQAICDVLNRAPELLAENAALKAEVERLREENERLSKPSMFWDWEDCENGCDDLSVIMDAHELGFVARIQCAKSLPDMWAVGYVTESGGFNAKAFTTKDEAEAFAAQREQTNER